MNVGTCEPYPECAREPTGQEEQEIDNALDAIGAAGCDQMEDFLRDVFNGGDLLVYDDYNGAYGDIMVWGGWTSPDSVIITLWEGTFSAGGGDGHEEETLRHEFGHYDLQGGLESEADGYVSSCDGSET